MIKSLPDGEYDTCPKYGPQVYMPTRRIVVKNNQVRLIEDPKWSWSVSYFFEVNNLFTASTTK